MQSTLTRSDFLNLLSNNNEPFILYKNAYFESLILSEILDLNKIEKSIYFEACYFTEDVNFSQLEFKEEIIFKECIFKKNAIFTSAHFYKSTVFYKNTFEADVLFNHTIWESFGQFAFSEFKGLCSFAFTIAYGFMNFNGIKFNTDNAKLDLHCSYFNRDANFSDSEIELNNLFTVNARENARIIKHHCINTNDRVLALKFHKYEMNALLNNPNISFQDKIILFLNRISNNHGDSWLRALVFLFFTTIPLFCLFYFIGVDNLPFKWGWESFNSLIIAFTQGLKYYLIILNPAHSYKDIDYLSLNIFGYIIDALSRILISYAIYQFVTAYRKHGKNIK